MFDLGDYLPYLVNRAGARLATEFGRDIAPTGIGVQEWRVLAALAAAGEQRLSGLAGLTSIDLSTLSRLVGRMVRDGLAARGRAEDDRRELRVAITAKGKRKIRAILPTARRYERAALAGFTPGEVQRLKRLLRRVYANLDAASERR
jgi:MarR family transcriptional regulator, organic hydroperoxide resistance regulator